MKWAGNLAFTVAALVFGAAMPALGQSTTQDFPTPVSTNEITGVIKARDIGDARLTTYYYTFNGDQGDLFINLVTRNLTGDVDVFAAGGLRPLTKITVYADYGESETGRAIYLRKPEKIILRVQGRTPNDDDASFRLKFAGSFAAVRPEDVPASPELPKVTADSRSGVRVNSVGTLLPSPPSPAFTETADEKRSDAPVAESVAEKKVDDKSDTDRVGTAPSKTDRPSTAEPPKRSSVSSNDINRRTTRKSTSVARSSEPAAADRPSKEVTTARKSRTSRKETSPTDENGDASAGTRKDAPRTENFPTLTGRKRAASPARSAEPKPDPLASINLVIEFKDGRSIEKRLTEVFKFSVDKGVLTVVLKDGGLSKYQMTDVAKVTIQ